MKTFSKALLLGAFAGGAMHAAQANGDFDAFNGHAVFVMTNHAERNEVVAYDRTPYGTLQSPHRYDTGGRGSGGTVDPLGSQGSLTLSQDGAFLLATNAGSGTLFAISCVRVAAATD